MTNATRTITHRTGLCMAALAGLMLAGCGGGIEGEHKVSELVNPQTGVSKDMSGEDFKVVVKGKNLSLAMPGKATSTATADEPITTGKWYTLMDNMAMKNRARLVEGEDYDMVLESTSKMMDKTSVSHLYFE